MKIMHTNRMIAPGIFLASLLGCASEPATEASLDTLKIKVSATGEIAVNGQAKSLAQVSTMLADLDRASGSVWYYREQPDREPHPNAMQLLNLLIEERLPIRLCTTPDFSDSVDEQGDSEPGT